MSHAQPALRDGHELRLLEGSVELFPALVADMDRATRTVRMETYIFDFTGSGAEVAQALQIALGRHDHAGGAGDRLDDEAKELLRRMKGDLPKNFVQTAVDTVIAAHTKATNAATAIDDAAHPDEARLFDAAMASFTDHRHDAIADLEGTVCIGLDYNPCHVVARNSWEAERNKALHVATTKSVVDWVHARRQHLDHELAR